MHKKIFRALIVLSCALIFLGSCDKKKGCTDSAATNFDSEAEVDCCCEYDTIPADSLATFSMNLAQFVGSEVFIPGNTYSIGGVKTQLEIARFYISNVRLINASGNEVPFEGLYLLADPGFDNYDLGNAPAGEYTKILFDVGLDEETNHSDPGDYPSSSPLSYQSPAMNWGWSFGYMFILIHGEVDTDGDDITDAALINHLGTDELLRTVEVDYDITSTAGVENVIHLKVNWADFYAGVDLSVDYQTEVTDDPALAETLMNNVPGMISKEE